MQMFVRVITELHWLYFDHRSDHNIGIHPSQAGFSGPSLNVFLSQIIF